ncbi:MAG: ribbon-helix-helix protein, CopG family [Clostridia bacterium]|nr:ribbon-helix-helix protein, CopG family [Clostridia bacterium]MBC7338836.1 ribbon-helix-helix protein, CopG family [Bacillota bacterium]
MVRTQVQLTEEQARALKKLAAEQGKSIAELIRKGVDLVIASSWATATDERISRAIALAGRFRSGLRDLSVEHDKYLAEAYRE